MPRGAGSQEFHPTLVGEAVPGVVLFIEPRAGRQVELLEAEALGHLDGATVELFASPADLDASGDYVIGTRLIPIEHTFVALEPGEAPAAFTMGIVARLTPDEPGRYEITGIRLTYRVDGNRQQTSEGISSVFTVCAGVETLPPCEELDD